MKTDFPSKLAILLALASLCALTACGKKDAPQAGAPGAGAPPPPEVAVVSVNPHSLALTTELPGRIEATKVAQVRARVPGIVLKQSFREGSEVRAGQELFRIDSAALEAALANAGAAVAAAESALTQADIRVNRYKPLVAINAVSRQDYDDAVSQQRSATAQVAAAKAQQRTAQINLSYATVVAPISGRIGRAQVTEGALVGQGETTPLAVIQQINPIWVNLTQSSSDILKMRRAIASGQLRSLQGQPRVSLVTEDGQPYPLAGRLMFSDLTVDPSTGAITVRAEFPNPQGLLLPGMYVRAKLEEAVNASAITVPQQAVVRAAGGASVMLVGADGKVVAQPVTTGRSEGDQIVINSGLKEGDRVIVEGLQKVKPGAPVKAVAWQPAGATSAPAAAPAAASAPSAR